MRLNKVASSKSMTSLPSFDLHIYNYLPCTILVANLAVVQGSHKDGKKRHMKGADAKFA